MGCCARACITPGSLYVEEARGPPFYFGGMGMRSFFKKLLAASVASTLFILLLPAVRADSAPRRIISLTPVGTEILFALGQETTSPVLPNSATRPRRPAKNRKSGGFAMINLETLLAMDTDLIVMQDIHSQLVPRMEQLKIPRDAHAELSERPALHKRTGPRVRCGGGGGTDVGGLKQRNS